MISCHSTKKDTPKKYDALICLRIRYIPFWFKPPTSPIGFMNYPLCIRMKASSNGTIPMFFLFRQNEKPPYTKGLSGSRALLLNRNYTEAAWLPVEMSGASGYI